MTAGEMGTGILFPLKVMRKIFKGGEGGQDGSERKEVQTVFMLVRQTHIFSKEHMSHSSILVARCEIGFPPSIFFLR